MPKEAPELARTIVLAGPRASGDAQESAMAVAAHEDFPILLARDSLLGLLQCDVPEVAERVGRLLAMHEVASALPGLWGRLPETIDRRRNPDPVRRQSALSGVNLLTLGAIKSLDLATQINVRKLMVVRSLVVETPFEKKLNQVNAMVARSAIELNSGPQMGGNKKYWQSRTARPYPRVGCNEPAGRLRYK